MPETNPDYVTDPDPAGVVVLTGVMLCVLIFAVAGLVLTFTGPETATDPHLEPSPSTSSTWSPECTAEDLDDGACYTYDDIRDLEWHTQDP